MVDICKSYCSKWKKKNNNSYLSESVYVLDDKDGFLWPCWALSQPPPPPTRQPRTTERSKLSRSPCGSSLALQPLGAHPWCSFPRGVTWRQTKWCCMQRREREVWEGRDEGTWEGERGREVLWMSVAKWRLKGEERGEWRRRRVWLESGYKGLTGRTDGRENCLKKEYNEDEAALAAPLRPITLLLPLSSISPLLPLSLCPLLSLASSLPLSHFLYLSSNYPCAVSSNRSLNDTGLHWQVLSSRATIGKKDLRKDKIGPTNSDNSKHEMARHPSDTVLHCHLVAGDSAGAPSEDADH